MLELAFKNKYLIIVLALLIAILGLLVMNTLPLDILPSYKPSAVQVLTLYPGMPAEVMEKDITSRIERWTGQSNGIARQESKSMIGVSIVKDFFRDEIDPNTALSQVTSLAMSDLYYLPPGTIPPMVMPYDPTASIPLALLAVSSDSLSEKGLYDIAYFQLRNLLGSVQGIIAPAVYGGKLRRIYMYCYPDKLQAYHLSQTDVVDAVQKNNVMIPTGDVNIGDMNYTVNANGMLPKVEDFNNIVIKMKADGAPIFLKDIGYAKDASAIQTNVVHINGKRQVYIPIYKRTGANTIASVEAVKGKLAALKTRIPNSVNLDVILDQSSYVRNSINGLIKEGVIGLILVSLALFLFLGNIRSTLIVALSIPLSILFAFLGLYFTGNSINSMTLGGLALAIGLLVDDSIVVLENIDKHRKLGKTSSQAAYDGTKEVGMPVLVTTLTIIIVFFPVIFLTGISKYLFTPLAIVVSLAMIGSRFISMTLVPIMAASLFKDREISSKSKGILASVDRYIEKITGSYVNSMKSVMKYKWSILLITLAVFIVSMFGLSKAGTELFPKMDVGQISIDVRLESGTRLEKSEEKIGEIEKFLKTEIGNDVNIIVSNIGVLNDWPAAYTPNSGTQDANIAVQLKEGYQTRTSEYVRTLRPKLKDRFPGVQFVFNTGGIVTSALNFGLPSPIDVQITGNDLYIAHDIAEQVRAELSKIKGTQDVRIQQRYDHPEIKLDIDRTKAAQFGIHPEEIVKNTVSALNSSVNFKPSFWIDEKNGNHYFVGVTYPEVELDNLQAIEQINLSGSNNKNTQLGNLAKTSLGSAPIELNHLDIQRVTDVYANVEGRDIGSVSTDAEQALQKIIKNLPSGYNINMRGEIKSMRESFSNLGLGLFLAILLVYLVIVPLLRSFTLPLIIISVIPLGLIGVSAMMLATNTYLNIQSLMGIIMMVGISVAYSNLLVDKMNNLLKSGETLQDAINLGIANRFRPIIMTAIVTISALIPMALGYEIGGEANIPLARAIIGGVLAATLLSLFVVPILFYLFNQKSASKMKFQNKALPVLLLLTLGMFACKNEKPKDNVEVSSKNPTVMVQSAEKRAFSSALEITGTAVPYQKTTVYAMTNGYLKKLNVDIGSAVSKGQILATLENPSLYNDKEKIQAEYDFNKTTYSRLKNVYDKTPQLTTISDLETAEVAFKRSNALLNAINQQIQFLTIKAPFSGIIVNRYLDAGALIQNALNNANAQALFEVQNFNPIRIVMDVPEADAVVIKQNTEASINFPELPNAKYKAKVSRIAYGLDTDSKTMKAEIDLPNKDFKLRPGMYAKITIDRNTHNDVFSVPNEAIGNLKGQSFVYVVNDGIVKKILVQLGISNAKYTELLDADLKLEDKIVVQGKEFCYDGARVTTKDFIKE